MNKQKRTSLQALLKQLALYLPLGLGPGLVEFLFGKELLTLLLSMAALLGAAIYLWQVADNDDEAYGVGDQVYLLGYVMTLSAIIGMVLGHADELEAARVQTILYLFAIKLGTSVFGILMMLTIREAVERSSDPGDAEEEKRRAAEEQRAREEEEARLRRMHEATEALAQRTAAYAQEVEQATGHLERLSLVTGEASSGPMAQLPEALANLQAFTDQAGRTMRDIRQPIESFAAQLDYALSNLEAFQAALNPQALQAIGGRIQTLEERITGLGSACTEVENEGKRMSVAFAAAGQETLESAERLAAQMDALIDRNKARLEELDAASGPLEDASVRAETFAQVMEHSSTSLQGTVRDFDAAMRQVVEAIAADTPARFEEFGKQLDTLRDALASVGEAAADQKQALASTRALLQATIQQLSDLTDPFRGLDGKAVRAQYEALEENLGHLAESMAGPRAQSDGINSSLREMTGLLQQTNAQLAEFLGNVASATAAPSADRGEPAPVEALAPAGEPTPGSADLARLVEAVQRQTEVGERLLQELARQAADAASRVPRGEMDMEAFRKELIDLREAIIEEMARATAQTPGSWINGAEEPGQVPFKPGPDAAGQHEDHETRTGHESTLTRVWKGIWGGKSDGE